MLEHPRGFSYAGLGAPRNAFFASVAATAAGSLMILAPVAPACAQSAVGLHVGGPGQVAPRSVADAETLREVSLTFDYAELAFNNRIVEPATANLGFVWDASAAPACNDDRNNDDYTTLGRGAQDTLVDFPADPECASPLDASEDAAGVQDARGVKLTGTLARNGRLSFAAAGIDIPSVWAFSGERGAAGDRAYRYDFIPVGAATGILNPFTREIGFALRFRIRISAGDIGSFGDVGETCYVGSVADPIHVRLSTVGAHSPAGLPALEGRAYDAETGRFELVGYNVRDSAGAAGCGTFGARDAVIAAAFGVPAAAGNIRMTLRGSLEPVVAPAAGTDPTMMRSWPEPAPANPPREAQHVHGDTPELAVGAADAGATRVVEHERPVTGVSPGSAPVAQPQSASPVSRAASAGPSVGAALEPSRALPAEVSVGAAAEPSTGPVGVMPSFDVPITPPGDASKPLQAADPNVSAAAEAGAQSPAPAKEASLPLVERDGDALPPTPPPMKAGPSAAAEEEPTEDSAAIAVRELDAAHLKTMAPQLTEPSEVIMSAPRVPDVPDLPVPGPAGSQAEPPAALGDSAAAVPQDQPDAAAPPEIIDLPALPGDLAAPQPEPLAASEGSAVPQTEPVTEPEASAVSQPAPPDQPDATGPPAPPAIIDPPAVSPLGP